MNAAEIAAALGGPVRRTARGVLVRCPAHADRTPSLHLSDGPGGRLLWRCFGGCTQETVRDALAQFGLLVAAGQHRAPRARKQAPEHVTGALERERIEAARQIWRAARPVTPDDPAGRYLTSRSLPGPWPATLRFLPSARHPTSAMVPALVAAACRWPDRTPAAVQLTALTAEGRKAPVEPVRWTRGVLRGAAVRLAKAESTLGLAEGVETGLSVLQAYPELPVWATLGASGLRGVILPSSVREVVILADRDEPGENAARVAAQRFVTEGRKAKIARPPWGKDFNDVLVGQAEGWAA